MSPSTPKKQFTLFTLPAFLLMICSLAFPLTSHQQWSHTISQDSLSNGLRIIFQRDQSSSLTVVQILVQGGKRREPEGKKGLAYLTTRLSLEIPDRSKIQNMMNQATRIRMFSKEDYSLINLACLSENLEDAVKLLSEIMLDPLFSGLRINRIKERMIHAGKTEQDDPVNIAQTAALDHLYQESPYTGSVLGSEASLDRIKKKHIKRFYQEHFKAGNLIVGVISDLEKEKALEIIRTYFENIPPRKPAETKDFFISPSDEKSLSIKKETHQSLVGLYFPLHTITPQNYALAHLLENFLGKGPDSLLWTLRSEKKLAYNVNSRVMSIQEGGILETYLETDHSKTEAAREALKTILINLYKNGLTSEDLAKTKTHTKASFLRSNETKENRAHTLVFFEALGFGWDFFSRYLSALDAVSLENMNAYIKDILDPQKSLEITVGPSSSISQTP